MKTKNLICGIAGVLATVSAANALTTAEIKDRCMNAPNRVWDSKNSVCISKTPCRDSAYDKYCNRIFKDVQVEKAAHAKQLIDLYLKKQNLSCSKFDMDEAHRIGQDRIRCHLSDGSYMEFEFDDYNESIQYTANYGYAKGVCLIYGGRPEKVKIEQATESDFAWTKDLLKAKVAGDLIAFVPTPVIIGAALADPALEGTFLQCSYIDVKDCDEMYSGQAAYSENKRACLPKSDFIY